jgi:hypothetical protein
MISVLSMPRERSSLLSTAPSLAVDEKLGHPEPESYLLSEGKSSCPHPAHL